MAVGDVKTPSPYDSMAGTAGLYGAAATSVLGFVNTVFSVREQAKQAKALESAAQREITAAMSQASEIERAAYQRAYAALFDTAIVNAISDETIRGFVYEGRRAEGTIIAQTAGAGLALTGSPLLAATAVAGEVARATAFENFKRRTQIKQFTFETTEELRRAQQARQAATITAEGIQASTTAQFAAMSAESLKDTLSSMKTTLGYVTSPTIQDALKTGWQHLFPGQGQSALAQTPQRSQANM